MAEAIVVQRLVKDYGDVRALDTVDVTIPAGHITGIVGPNGAGKTTLIKALVGALQPTSGLISVLNLDPIKQRWALRKQLGYMPQESALYDDLSARENVMFFARVHRLANTRQMADQLLTELDLGDRLNGPVHTFSGGMQKRVSLACALIHNPALLILDEPTAALDPLLKRHLWNRFRVLAQQGKTLIVTTHLMDEAMLCDQVVLMQYGRVVAHDAPRNLIATGTTVMRFRQGTETWNETMPTEGWAIAMALHRHGLQNAIDEIDITTENLEDVMVHKLKGPKT